VMEDQYKEQNRQILRRRLPASMLLLYVLYVCPHTTMYDMLSVSSYYY
jgi:hypothetical protein